MLTALKSKITDDPYVISTSLAQGLHTRRLMLTALKRKIADDPYVGGTYLLAKSFTLDISCLYTALKRNVADDPHVAGTTLAQVLHTRRFMLTAFKRKIADDPYVGGTSLAQALHTRLTDFDQRISGSLLRHCKPKI